MLRFLYLAGIGYLAICLLALASSRAGAPVLAHSSPGVVVAPGRGDAGTWFAGIKPFCNSVEVETAQQRNPAPAGAEGQGYAAACYALAGRIDQARAVIERLSGNDRSYAASIVFGVGHPVADAGDDKSAGPIMELVIEFQKMATLEAPNLPLVELESITVASTRVQNHSNDPNYLAASWYDIWLSA